MKLLLSSGSVPGHGIGDAFRLAHEHGFDGLELIMPSVDWRPNQDEFKALRESYGIYVGGVHAPFYTHRLGQYLLRPRREAERNLRATIAVAEVLGAHYVVIHPFPAMFFRGRTRDLMAELLDAAARDTDLIFSLEVLEERRFFWWRTRPYGIGDPAELFGFAKEHGFSMTLDCAHALTLGIPPHRLFEQSGRRVNNIHLSDGDGRRCHLPLGQGIMDFAAFFASLSSASYDGFLTLEVESASEFQLNQSVSVVRFYLERGEERA